MFQRIKKLFTREIKRIEPKQFSVAAAIPQPPVKPKLSRADGMVRRRAKQQGRPVLSAWTKGPIRAAHDALDLQ